MAFTTLGLAELFHMIGMSNIKKSFIYVFKGTNWFFIVAFGFGLILQILVTEVPGLTDIFLGHSNGNALAERKAVRLDNNSCSFL